MEYDELVRAYFERSTALQWYWTIYVLVIGGILAFSTFRLRPHLATTILVTLLYIGFAYKNLGAIEQTATERAAFLTLINDYPAGGPNSEAIARTQSTLGPAMPPYDLDGARHFHILCDILTVLLVWVKEHRRRRVEAAETRDIKA